MRTKWGSHVTLSCGQVGHTSEEYNTVCAKSMISKICTQDLSANAERLARALSHNKVETACSIWGQSWGREWMIARDVEHASVSGMGANHQKSVTPTTERHLRPLDYLNVGNIAALYKVIMPITFQGN